MFNYIKFIKLTFWFVSLPVLGVEGTYFLFAHVNPLDSNLFLLSMILWVPMMIVKTQEFQDQVYDDIIEELRNMTSAEFAKRGEEIMGLPHVKNAAIFKEAYRQVYREKYGRK
jgi:hypothetical protein